jgi:hypothetical protein
VDALTKLLEPSDDFIKLAVGSIETRSLHPYIVKEWRPILTNALQEWVKLKALNMALERPTALPPKLPSAEAGNKRTFKGKVCPSCGAAGLGFRLTACNCGYVFKKDESTDQQPGVLPEQPQPETNEANTIPFVAKDVS